MPAQASAAPCQSPAKSRRYGAGIDALSGTALDGASRRRQAMTSAIIAGLGAMSSTSSKGVLPVEQSQPGALGDEACVGCETLQFLAGDQVLREEVEKRSGIRRAGARPKPCE